MPPGRKKKSDRLNGSRVPHKKQRLGHPRNDDSSDSEEANATLGLHVRGSKIGNQSSQPRCGQNENQHDLLRSPTGNDPAENVLQYDSFDEDSQNSYTLNNKTPVCSEADSLSENTPQVSDSDKTNLTLDGSNMSHNEAPGRDQEENKAAFPVSGGMDIKTMVTVKETFGNIDDIESSEDDLASYESGSYCTSLDNEPVNENDSESPYEKLQSMVNNSKNRLTYNLNQVDREGFVLKIMKTFKTNSLYDAFCYTLPRSSGAEKGYNQIVHGLLDLSKSCKFGILQSTITAFPSDDSIDSAECIVQDMRKRYKKLIEDDTVENSNSRSSSDNVSDILEKEVDNDLPHNIVYMVSDGITDVVSNWSGQFQVCVNPINNTLSLRMFEFTPTHMQRTRLALTRKQLSVESCKDIINEMEKFECSRQFRMDADFDNLQSLTFYKSSENEGILFIKINNPAKFYQRFVNTNARDRNKWEKRRSFLPFNYGCYQDFVLVLGGVVSELSNIAAQITVACPSVDIIETDINKFMLHQPALDSHWSPQYAVNQISHEKMLTISYRRRKEILSILLDHGLIPESKWRDLSENISVTDRNVTQGSECNCLKGLDFHPCFLDYIDYKCLDVSELEHLLAIPCNILQRDDDARVDSELQNVNLADFLLMKTDRYFSFCHSGIASEELWHCHVCGKCNQNNVWHCPNCDKCSKRELVCEYCGLVGSTGCTFIILPGSVDGSTIPKPEWKIPLTNTDVPQWAESIESVSLETVTFNVEDFKQDELGLIDPMAFLLGIEARGGGNRQGRCRQKYQRIVEGDPKLLAAAGCILQ